MANRLAGKTALITGSASGIGLGVARRFAAEGAVVILADRDGAKAEAEAAAIGAGAIAVQMDISSEESVADAYASVAERGLALDVVVANAGVQLFGRDAPIADLDLDSWRATVDINLTGTFLTVKYAVRAMLDTGGSIILTGSPTGLNGEGKDFTAYSTTKAGIHGMARTVGAAYADRGIRVNVAVPGYTETPLVTTIRDDAEARASIIARTPLGRAGRPEDVEGIMVFLASDESSFATAAIFRVDGGMTSI